MEITEVKVYPRENRDRKLKAYATLTFDNCFVVRDVRIIDGKKGLFVAMPSRKLKELCPRCNHRNEVASKFCNYCGTNLEAITKSQQPDDRKEDHRDIAHPITSEARQSIQKAVLEKYEKQLSAKRAEETLPRTEQTEQ